MPALILVDLGLPGDNGFELVRDLKADERLCCIPAIVLSGAGGPDNVREAYRVGAAAFLTKPADFDGMLKLCESLRQFWLNNDVLAPTGS